MPGWIEVERDDEHPEVERADEHAETARAGAPEPAAGDGPAEASAAESAGRQINLAVPLGLVLLVAVVAAGVWFGRAMAGGLPDGPLGDVLGAAPSDDSPVVATVGESEITERDIDVEFATQTVIQGLLGRAMNPDPSVAQAFRRDVLDQLVDQQLVLDAAKAAGVTMSEAEVDAELPTLGGGYGLDEAAIRQGVLAEGITEAEYRDWARRKLIVGRYLRTEHARDLYREQLIERGASRARVESAPDAQIQPQPSELAAQLQKNVDVRFYFDGSEDGVPTVREGAPAPDFTLMSLGGQPVSLSDFRGQPVMINFWATWCGPCRVEMPLFVDTYEKNRDELVVLAVDVQEDAATVAPFVEQYGLTFPVVLDEDGTVATIYRVRGLPTTIFVDREGVVTEAHRGAITSRPDLMPLLRQILPDAASWLAP